jgi:Flp pilus assembly pilin Flp
MMMDLALTICVKTKELRNVLQCECGQNLVEYALVIGLVVFGAVAASKGLATTIGTGLTSVGTKLTAYTS